MGIFTGGLTDSLSNLVINTNTKADLNTVTDEDGDIAISINDAAFGNGKMEQPLKQLMQLI